MATTPEARFEEAAPSAPALLESLRAFGYSPESAIADLIDNSISAGAHQIDIDFTWDGPDSIVSIADDGRGMTVNVLKEAMRHGSQHPDLERSPDDLGRFGLGMKTASMSQCRRLSVASKSSLDEIAARIWDLDYVNSTKEWRLLLDPSEAASAEIQTHLKGESGTIVIWESLEKLVGDEASTHTRAHARFLEMVERVEEHLASVFSQFLSGTNRISITINGAAIKPWDPFLTNERATQQLASELFSFGDYEIDVSPFVLPHHSRLKPDTHEYASGPKGWNAQQGFYVFRGGRLLVSGDWLGLGFKQEEHYKLARIRVDIPNAADSDWDIDVRKSWARPPPALRDDFRRIARVTRQRASEVYRHKGRAVARKSSQDHVFLWQRKFRGGEYSYVINRKHPLVVRAVDNAVERGPLTALLHQIEETIPFQEIWVDGNEHPDSEKSPYSGVREKEVLSVMTEIYQALIDGGAHPKEAMIRISAMDPFDSMPEMVAVLSEQIGEESSR